MRVAATGVALALVATLARPAAAELSDRAQIMISDGLSDGLALTILSDDATKTLHAVPFYVGYAGYALGGPIIHASHHDWGRAGISLGARVVSPPLFAYIGGRICDSLSPRQDEEWFHCLGSAAIGASVGLLGAEILDWTVISRGPQPRTLMLTFGGSF